MLDRRRKEIVSSRCFMHSRGHGTRHFRVVLTASRKRCSERYQIDRMESKESECFFLEQMKICSMQLLLLLLLPSWLNGNAGSVTLVFIRNDLLLT